jgi:hypothetical protein
MNGYASSKMARLVLSLRNSQNVDDYKVADFESYYPSLGDPKAFVATPVFDVRACCIMLPAADRADQQHPVGQSAMAGGGSGKTGEVYLVADRTMRNDSRF